MTIPPDLQTLEQVLTQRLHAEPGLAPRLLQDPAGSVEDLGFRLPGYLRVEIVGGQVRLHLPAAPSMDPRPVFFDPGAYPFLASWQQRWPELRREGQAVIAEMQRLGLFYPEHFRRDHLLTSGLRGRCMLWFLGMRLQANLRRYPVAAELCWGVPGLVSAGFYVLGPQTRMQAHTGIRSDILRAHLGLVVPPDCALRVAFETRPWVENQFLIFDDTHLHEAWNLSSEYRCVLHLDFLQRPLPEVEHAAQLRSLRARYLAANPGFHSWLLAAETETDSDQRALLEAGAAQRPEEVAAARALVREHGAFI